VANVARTLKMMSGAKACGEEGLDTMRRLDLESTLLQGVGLVEGNTLVCSSFGGARPFQLGPVDYVSQHGALIRTEVPFLNPEPAYVIVQSGAAAGIVHPDLALSFVNREPGLVIVAFAWSTRLPVLRRGAVPADLELQTLEPGTAHLDGGSVRAVVRSARTDFGVVAILPRHANAAFNDALRQLVPAGVVIGLIIAALIVLAARDRTSLYGMIKTAIAKQHFSLRYQPIVELASGRIVAIEALLRWDRESGRGIPPDIFVPVAEERGLMPAVTARVFDLLEADLPALLDVAPDLKVAVNLTASDMHGETLADAILRFVERVGMAPEQLVIEATERTLVEPELAELSLGPLRSHGVRVAIDDFGTGYSSLAYLAEMKVDILKIDKLFIHALGTGSATSEVAHSVIAMARTMRLMTVAEGIETADQEQIVRALGVDWAQGFHFSQPLERPELAALLRQDAPGRKTVAA
jgi:sensor c-di-GMP phosphodiesterase-like protein